MYQIFFGSSEGYGASIAIPNVGVFYLLYNADGAFAGAINHTISASGSPLVVQFDSATVNLGDVYQAVMAKLPQ